MPARPVSCPRLRLLGGRSRVGALCALCALAMLAALPARVAAAPLSAANGELSAFPSYGAVGGTLTAIGGTGGGDARAFSGRVLGTTPSEYARGRFNVTWAAGSRVSWGASFYLPPRYHTVARGQVTLMRWDTYRAGASSWEDSAMILNVATNTATLTHELITSRGISRTSLAKPLALPIGRWFSLTVTQTLGNTGAGNAISLDGTAVGHSTTANLRDGSVTAVRYGIVVVSGNAARGRLALRFDAATADSTAAATAAPPTTPPPSTSPPTTRPPSTSPPTSTDPPSGSLPAPYVSPFTTPYTVGRTDMGLDVCLPVGAPIDAVGNAVVLGVIPNWYTDPKTHKPQPYVWYQLLDGPRAGQVVYLAEQIRVTVAVGARLTAGQPLATFAPSGTCIETGWGDPNGSWRTLAQATTGYKEGQVTAAGVSFARFLASLSANGPLQLG